MTLFSAGAAHVMAGPAAPSKSDRGAVKPSPRPYLLQTVKIVIVALGLLLAVEVGGVIADGVNAYTPGLILACFLGPVFVASAVFWLIGQLL
jgi:hypothetical protein